MSLISGKRSKTYWIRMRQTWEDMLVLFTCRSYAQSITTLIRTQRITWHDQAIPQGEIWLKLGRGVIREEAHSKCAAQPPSVEAQPPSVEAVTKRIVLISLHE